MSGAGRPQRVRDLLARELQATQVQVQDDSASHGRGGQATHLRVLVVSQSFAGQTPVQRHRSVYKLLGEELRGGLHALAIQALTPSEWDGGDSRPPPPCAGA